MEVFLRLKTSSCFNASYPHGPKNTTHKSCATVPLRKYIAAVYMYWVHVPVASGVRFRRTAGRKDVRFVDPPIREIRLREILEFSLLQPRFVQNVQDSLPSLVYFCHHWIWDVIIDRVRFDVINMLCEVTFFNILSRFYILMRFPFDVIARAFRDVSLTVTIDVPKMFSIGGLCDVTIAWHFLGEYDVICDTGDIDVEVFACPRKRIIEAKLCAKVEDAGLEEQAPEHMITLKGTVA